MELLPRTPSSYYETFKRYWRKTKYERLNQTRHACSIRRLKIIRLGGTSKPRPSRRHYSKISTPPKLGLKMLSPVKLLTKFHNTYTEMMIRLAMSIDRSKSSNVFGGPVKKGNQVSFVSTGEEVDSKLVMEIYKKFAASRESVV